MVHLFNKVYLCHESIYNTQSESLLLFSEKRQHPITRNFGIEAFEIPLFDEILGQLFDNSEEKFWQTLLAKNPQKKFSLFADTQSFSRLLIQFWKSIFPNHTPKGLFKLYQFFLIDNRLKSFLKYDHPEISRQYLQKELNFLTFEEFEKVLNTVPKIECLSQTNKSHFSFEYLLADYFYNNNSKYAYAFKNKIKDLAWRSWINDAEILKAEILNSFYDIKRIVPDFEVDFNDPKYIQHLEKYIKIHPKLSWMLDPLFDENNAEYIRANYKVEIFTELYTRVHHSWGENPNYIGNESLGLLGDDHVLQTNHVFNERYTEYLLKNINKAFGCIFTNDHLRNKSNQLLPGYVYECVRNNTTELLKEFELS